MPRLAGSKVVLTVRGLTFSFTDRALAEFPEAAAFLDSLVAGGRVSTTNASYYVKLVARLKRQGRLNQPELLVHRVERTAANAYWRWIHEGYSVRVQPVVLAFSNADVARGIRWLRRSSLVPPYPGKVLRRRLLPIAGVPVNARQYVEEPNAQWTLHVPTSADARVHEDPCADCAVVTVSQQQLEVIAIAFGQAWGHQNLNAVPPDAFLFGQPPVDRHEAVVKPTARIVALLPSGAHADAVEQIGGTVARYTDAFVERLRENVDTVTIDFAAAGREGLHAAFAAAWSAAERWATRPADSAALPANVVPLHPAVALPANDHALPGAPLEMHVPVSSPIEILAPSPSTAPSWESIAGPVEASQLVHCTVHATAHRVEAGQQPCAPGAWSEIPN